jgi:hypothetical protein
MAKPPKDPRPQWQKLSSDMLQKPLPLNGQVKTAHHFVLDKAISQKEFMEGYLTWLETLMVMEREFIKHQMQEAPPHVLDTLALSLIAHHLPPEHQARKQPPQMQQMLDHFHEDLCSLPQVVGFLEFAAKGNRPSRAQAEWLRQGEVRLRELDRWLTMQIKLLDETDKVSMRQRQTQFGTIMATKNPAADASFRDICDKRVRLIEEHGSDEEYDRALLEEALLKEYQAVQPLVQGVIEQVAALEKEIREKGRRFG